ncbi:MAG: AAA family ATPase [Bradyrhizobium sp.]|nr:AAA family ATPase [Bradyrhizobium sp.]
MHIEYLEIGNYRKLLSVRIDLAKDKTIFVGANNSGKTSAMTALRHFLVGKSEFSLNDFTIAHWPLINLIGEKWAENATAEMPVAVPEWSPLLPFLDIWISIRNDEVHYVRDLIPTLTWNGGSLGVRLRLQPKDSADLQKMYLAERAASITARKLATAAATEAAKAATKVVAAASAAPGTGVVIDGGGIVETAVETEFSFALWPKNLLDFLRRRLRTLFEVRAYLLDPAKCAKPIYGIATPQLLPPDAEPLEGDPLKGLIRINEIDAQRSFGQPSASDNEGETESGSRVPTPRESRKLSEQLRAYYAKHLDPFDQPEPADFAALNAIDVAQKAFDKRLREGFSGPLAEVEGLGYPGVSNPRLRISTRVRPIDGLNHDAAVQYEVGGPSEAEVAAELRLPEDYNGLGYQNLISMVFKLMSYRDGWMKVGKAGKQVATSADAFLPPLHLVLVEEPEAHLHAQVQQVFIQQAYKVLRKHPLLGEKTDFTTQLIVSTHSSHIAHECEFSSLRYFRRLAANKQCTIPTTSVVDLSDAFGEGETQRFVTRYIKAVHCDLFFADAAVLVEGPAERILVPYFVRQKYEFLTQCYLSWLEIGGSHAHRLQPLLEKLGLTALIITDIDAMVGTPSKAVQPQRGAGQTTRNKTLETWIPRELSIDDLLDRSLSERTSAYDGSFAICVAYQQPIKVNHGGASQAEALANTFEDALVFQNLEIFKDLPGYGLIAKFREAIASQVTTGTLGEAMFKSLKDGVKAELALDLLEIEKADQLAIPRYIDEGLGWLEKQLRRKQHELLEVVDATVEAGGP